MKVLHITNNYPTKNFPIFGIFVKEQIESLTKLGIENEVFFINGRENGKLEYLKSILQIRKKLKKKSFDVIHCHHALSALCLILSGKSNKNKVIVSFQNDPVHEQGKRIFKFIKAHSNAWIFKNNSALITDNQSFYLSNGVDTNFFKPIDKLKSRTFLNLDPDAIYLLFVSSNLMREQKRYDRFIETITILKEKYNYQNVQELKMINTAREKVPYYFNAADLHLLTSDFEGSPNSVKESMACNTPVVATNVGNVSELLKNTIGSYVAKNNTAEELAELVDKVLKEKEIKLNGIEQISELELDIHSVAAKLKTIYTKI